MNARYALVLILVCVSWTGCTSREVGTEQGQSPIESTIARKGAESTEAEAKSVAITIASVEQIKAEISQGDKKLTVVDFWSTSCIPCMKEFPQLVELSTKHSDTVKCISVNVDYLGLKGKPPESYQDRAVEFLRKVQAVEVVNLLASDTDERVGGEFNYAAIPSVLIFDSQGEMVHQFTDSNTDGGVSYERDVVPAIESLIAGRE